MTDQQAVDGDLARSFAHTIAEAWRDQASLFLALPEDAWSGRTGCAKWTMHDLAGHIVGEAVWFANLVRGVTDGAKPFPNDVWDTLKNLPGAVDGYAMLGAADLLLPAVEEATDEQLQQTVDMGFTRLPLRRALYIGLLEAVLHNWDGRVGQEPRATIPMEWARQVATLMADFARGFAHDDGAADAAGRYLLQVGDGVGPVTVTIDGTGVTVERGREGEPDVTIHLTADQYVRLLAGRLPLHAAMESGGVTVEGDRDRAQGLNRVFSGIAN